MIPIDQWHQKLFLANFGEQLKVNRLPLWLTETFRKEKRNNLLDCMGNAVK